MASPLGENPFSAALSTDTLDKAKGRLPLSKLPEAASAPPVQTPRGEPRPATLQETQTSSAGLEVLAKQHEEAVNTTGHSAPQKVVTPREGPTTSQETRTANVAKENHIAAPRPQARDRPPSLMEPIEPRRPATPAPAAKPPPTPVDPKKAEAQAKGNAAAQNIVDTWGAVKESEKLKKPAWQEEVDSCKAEAKTLREQIALGESARENPTSSFERHAAAVNLEANKAKLKEVENTLSLAEKNLKVSYSKTTKSLSTVERSSSEPPRGTSHEGRLAVKKAFVEIENAHTAGVETFELKNGQTVHAYELIDMVTTSQYGSAVIKNSSVLKKDATKMAKVREESEFSAKFEKPASEAREIVNGLNQGGAANLQRLEKNIAEKQALIIQQSPQKKELDEIRKTTEDPAEQEKLIKQKFTLEAATEFFAALKFDRGDLAGVDKTTMVQQMVYQIDSPRDFKYIKNNGFYSTNPVLANAMAPTGLQQAVAETAELVAQKKAGTLENETLLNRASSKIGMHKEGIQDGVEALIQRTVSFEGFDPGINQDLAAALPKLRSGSLEKKPNDWNAAFEVLTRVSQKIQ